MGNFLQNGQSRKQVLVTSQTFNLRDKDWTLIISSNTQARGLTEATWAESSRETEYVEGQYQWVPFLLLAMDNLSASVCPS